MSSPVGVSRAHTVVELPLSVVQASAGFSLDVGEWFVCTGSHSFINMSSFICFTVSPSKFEKV